jgi:hypothetical protein
MDKPLSGMKNTARDQNATPMDRYASTLKLNKTRFACLLVTCLVFVTTRLPLINTGFGLDADAWRIAGTAFDLRHHLSYHASRFPGYPLPEFVNSLVIDLGWVATNSLTMLLSLISLFAFARITKAIDLRHRTLMIITYAFLPILWINSTNTMDYMWSLCFIMLTWFLILKGRPVIGGIMFGLAIGSRPHAVVLALPFLYLCYTTNRSIKETVRFILSAAIATLVLFLPLFLTYGLMFFRRYPVKTNLLQVGYLTIKHIGLLGMVMLAVTVVLSPQNLRNMIKQRNPNDIFAISTVCLALISFSLTPYHFEYMIIFMPFMLMFIYRIGSRRLLIVLSVILISHACVTIGSFKHLGNNQLRFKLIDRGLVLRTQEARKQQLDFVKNLQRTDIDKHSMVIVGPYLPMIAYLDENVSSSDQAKRMYDPNQSRAGVENFKRDILYRYLLTPQELQSTLGRSYKIYYVEGVREMTMETYGYDLAEYETTFINL